MSNRLLEVKKRILLEEVSRVYREILSSKPRVDTGLGFFVDGGRDNKDDFKSKWELMSDSDTTTVKDADNNFHPNITKNQMETIWKSIVFNGETILREKWNLENAIKSAATIEELEAIGI